MISLAKQILKIASSYFNIHPDVLTTCRTNILSVNRAKQIAQYLIYKHCNISYKEISFQFNCSERTISRNIHLALSNINTNKNYQKNVKDIEELIIEELNEFI